VATIEEPGIYHGLTYAEYEAIPALRPSELKHWALLPTAAHVRYALDHPQGESNALLVGNAFHAAVLEPSAFSDRYAAAPQCDKRTKEGKATWAAFCIEHPKSEILSSPDMEMVTGMQESVWRHPAAKEILSGTGYNESAIVWEHPETAQLCKTRLDRISTYRNHPVIVNLKTTGQDAKSFAKAIANYGYHISEAMGLDGINELMPREWRIVYIVVEKSPPYATACFGPNPATIEEGRRAYEDALRRYQQCEENQNWPGYPETIQEVGLEKWAFKYKEAVT